jgi:hypothetical protein
VKAALIGAGQITRQHLFCLTAFPGVQDAGLGMLVKEGRFEANDAPQLHRARE